MSEPQGWIKLHRKLLEHPLFSDPQAFTLWVQLLLRANHKDARIMVGNKFVDIKRGELLTGRNKLVEYTGINRSKLERLLNLLESEQQIEQRKTTKYRLISIVNYDLYQGTEQPVSNKRATTEQQLSTNKNEKNNNNVKNDKKIDIPEKINIESWNEWIKYRSSKKKPVSQLAATKQFKLLVNYSLEEQADIIDKSISNDWSGLFELKAGNIDNSIPYQLIADAYDEHFASKLDLSKVADVTPKRKKAVAEIWNSGNKTVKSKIPSNTVDYFIEYFDHCFYNEFLSGRKTGFNTSFDYLTKYDTYINCIEGNYL